MRFYKQKKEWTCGAAAMRQALYFLGIHKKEETLVNLLKTSKKKGTENKNFPKLAEKLKLNYFVSRNSSINDLRFFLKKKYQIIICYYSYFSKQDKEGHFAVVKKISKEKIYLIDPIFGPKHKFSLNHFRKIWKGGPHLDNEKRWFFSIKLASPK